VQLGACRYGRGHYFIARGTLILKRHGVVRENPVIVTSRLTHLGDRAREHEWLNRPLVKETLDDGYVGLKN
jgi:hypothetical protein